VAFPPSEKYQPRGIEVKTIAETLVTYVVAREVVDRSLGQHGVVLELTLAERRSVGSNEDQLGLAGTQGLDGGLVAEGDWRAKIISDLIFDINLIEMSRTLSRLHHQRQTAGEGVTGLLALGGHRYAVLFGSNETFDLTEGWLGRCAPAVV
jgi:hypothetical protein